MFELHLFRISIALCCLLTWRSPVGLCRRAGLEGIALVGGTVGFCLMGKGGLDKGSAERWQLCWGSVPPSEWVELWPEYADLNFERLTSKRSQLKWRINWGNPLLCKWVRLTLKEAFCLALRGRAVWDELGKKIRQLQTEQEDFWALKAEF